MPLQGPLEQSAEPDRGPHQGGLEHRPPQLVIAVQPLFKAQRQGTETGHRMPTPRAAETLVGQAIGRRDAAELREACRLSMLWGFAGAAALAGQSALALVCAGIAAAAAGFLCFNFHPARIFMGDVGSVPLGFTAGALGLVGWRSGAWPLWFPLLVFAPFILDATVTLLRRALRGEKVWQAHRSHYYQRMVQMGLGHRGTALRAYGLMAGCGAAALAGLRMGFSLQCAIITMCITAHLIVGYRIDRAWRSHRAGEPEKP